MRALHRWRWFSAANEAARTGEHARASHAHVVASKERLVVQNERWRAKERLKMEAQQTALAAAAADDARRRDEVEAYAASLIGKERGIAARQLAVAKAEGARIAFEAAARLALISAQRMLVTWHACVSLLESHEQLAGAITKCGPFSRSPSP